MDMWQNNSAPRDIFFAVDEIIQLFFYVVLGNIVMKGWNESYFQEKIY